MSLSMEPLDLEERRELERLVEVADVEACILNAILAATGKLTEHDYYSAERQAECIVRLQHGRMK